ncbi:extended synaptotagmin-2-like [Sitodiplosis mosellana]|uniref:extended synaptotagmin-2-like n=1 Tax=Sitodiplosis mosellana TaxID=263140 RepID=UPI002444DC98|nr:extended synaptotagmin-2-like [Sitodiplosis mosellana]
MATVDVKTSHTEAINGTAAGTAGGPAAAAAAVKTSAIKNENEISIKTFIWAIVKKATVINAIYLVGYMNWSIAWLITPMILIETHNYWRETNGANRKFVRKIARQSAATNEKDVILANIKDLPSWVYFPDFQRCEWANSILQQIWPNVNDFLKNFVKNWLEKKIRKSLSKKKLNDFEFDRNRILFGTTPPRIGGLKVYDKNISRDEIIVDMELIFMSDCNVNFKLAGMSASLQDFEIHGMLRVIMKPLISKAPFIGGLQIFFLDKPHIDFNLCGASEVLKVPYLGDILRRVIAKKIAKIMVWPNKYPIKLTKKTTTAAIRMPQPEGVLRINIVEARDLIKQDIGGKSDPYAICNIGTQQFRTRTIYNNLNPVWNYWCEACIDVKCPRSIVFELLDWDRAGGSDPLGSATIDISHVVKNGSLDTWIYLEGVKHGELHVRFTWYELSPAYGDLRAALAETKLLQITKLSSAVLSVYIDSASDLPQIDDDCKPDPFVMLTVGNVEWKTSSKKETDSPVFEQGFTFLVANPEQDILQIRVAGKNPDEKHGDRLGRLSFNICELLTQNDLQIVSQPFELKKSGPTSKIIMSLALKILKRSENGSSELTPLEDTPIEEAEEPQEDNAVSDGENAPESDVHAEKVSNLGSILVESGPRNGESSLCCYGLGSIKLTLHYSIELQYLSVTVHKIINIPVKDQSVALNTYVKLYLLPGRSSDSKRKTKVVKDSSDPIYEENFRYLLSPAELRDRKLEVVVSTRNAFYALLHGSGSIVGKVQLSLDDAEIANGVTNFYDLLPENELD